jgi:DNA polymerase III epsilon subunit-like protein
MQFSLPLRLSEHQYVVVDTETTGLDPRDDRVVEVAAVRFRAGEPLETYETLVDPRRDIPPAASEQHHLVASDLRGARWIEDVAPELLAFVGQDIVVAHNAAYDRGMLPMLGDRTWLCSARAARHIWPEAPAHRVQFLRYWLALDSTVLRSAVAHRAAGDARVTGLIMHAALTAYEVAHPSAGISDFIAYVDSPVPVTVLRFGKAHYGKPLVDVPTGYFKWMMETVRDLDPDLRAAIIGELERRHQAGTCADEAA